ncbi:MAG: cytidylyltransferase domain-containing protein [Promethearchaeota archaeon]
MKVLGLVPARGGSKGIKDKNIVNLAGKPLISYVIEALKKSETVDKIVCTTDSEKIAEVAREYGAEAPFLRPAEMARDDSAAYPALMHAVKKIEELQNYRPDYIVTAQPTYPLMKPEQIDKAVNLAIEKQADSVVTVVELEHARHPYNIRYMEPDGTLQFWKEEEHYKYPTRQSKPQFYSFANILVTNYSTLMNRGRLEGVKNYPLVVELITSFDINIQEDLEIIEFIMKGMSK